MTVVYRASVPVYETECDECHSVIRYQKTEAWHNQCHINCPVCGVPIRALTVNPVTVFDDEEQKKRDTSNADRIRAMTDDGLAEWIAETKVTGCPGELIYKETVCDVMSCFDCWLDWLRKECE